MEYPHYGIKGKKKTSSMEYPHHGIKEKNCLCELKLSKN